MPTLSTLATSVLAAALAAEEKAKGKKTPTPKPENTPGPSKTPNKPTNTDDGGDAFTSILNFLIAYPWIPGGVIAIILINIGWRRLTTMQNLKGRALPGLGFTIKRVLRLALVEDKSPVFTKPEKVVKVLGWLQWRRYWLITVGLLIGVIVGITDRLPATIDLGLTILAGLMILHGFGHVRRVFQIRHRILMQMFEVAAAECRYLKGAELNPWAYIQISKWRDLYSPDTTTIMFPPRYRSEDPRNREAFELNFNGTVSDAHTWTYTWESANNRVIAEPVPYITTSAPYPFPDTHPWNEFPLGIGAGGKEVVLNVSTFPHCLLAGSTGSGKSVTQRTMLLHALQQPDMRVLLIDPKRVELSVYGDHPHVLKIATELDESTQLLEQAEAEMQSRYETMKNQRVNFFKDLPDPPPALLIMVDEAFALLSPEGIKSDEGKERDEMHARCTVLLGSIARLGRAAGIHLILATQRPDAKVIPGETRSNLDARIAQGRMDTTPSLMTLDSDAATRLPPIKGRAVYRAGNETSEFQAYFLPPEYLPQVLEMSAALATGSIRPEDLMDSGEEEKKGKRLKLPLPKGVGSRLSGWAEKRKAAVERNEEEARRFAGQQKRKGERGQKPKKDEVVATAPEPSVVESDWRPPAAFEEPDDAVVLDDFDGVVPVEAVSPDVSVTARGRAGRREPEGPVASGAPVAAAPGAAPVEAVLPPPLPDFDADDLLDDVDDFEVEEAPWMPEEPVVDVDGAGFGQFGSAPSSDGDVAGGPAGRSRGRGVVPPPPGG